MMNLSEEQIAQVEEFAKLFMSVSEIAQIIGADEIDLKFELMQAESPVTIAYNRGRLMAKAELNRSIIELAKQMSSPAQQLLIKLAQDAEIDTEGRR